MKREADFAFRQAFALCPHSAEVVFRYVNLLINDQRIEDALRLAETAASLDPENSQYESLVSQLTRMKTQQTK